MNARRWFYVTLVQTSMMVQHLTSIGTGALPTDRRGYIAEVAGPDGASFTVTSDSQGCHTNLILAGDLVTINNTLRTTRARKLTDEAINGNFYYKNHPGEGLLMSVINGRTGQLMLRKTFPLGTPFGFFLDLQWHLRQLQPGNVVALAVSAVGTVGLRKSADDLENLGSMFVKKLLPASHWIWVFIIGGRTIIEAAIPRTQNGVYSHAHFSLSNTSVNNFLRGSIESAREKLCQTAEGLGSYCKTDDPDPVLFAVKHLPNTEILDNVPIFVTGGYKIQYLIRTLRDLHSSPGFRKNNLEVLLGDTDDSVLTMLKLLNVKYTKISLYGEGNEKLFQYYRSCFQHALDNYPKSTAVIFLDEDIEVSPDFFSLMSQMIPLLYHDSSLYCVTAHAAADSPNFFGYPNRLKRGITTVLWGYALTIRFMREALSKWPNDRIPNLYDLWLNEVVADGRECAYPEVTRTKHVGAGTNTRGFEIERFFQPISIVQDYGIEISNLEQIPIDNWFAFMTRELEKAIPLVGNICEPNFFENLSNGTYVFYYSLDLDADETISIENLFTIGECLQFWAQSEVGHHQYTKILRKRPGCVIYLMGYPEDSYGHLKKTGYHPWNIINATRSERKRINKQRDRHTLSIIENVKTKLNSIIYDSGLFNV